MATVERTNCTLFWWMARFSALWTLSGLVGLILFSQHFATPLNVSVLVAVDVALWLAVWCHARLTGIPIPVWSTQVQGGTSSLTMIQALLVVVWFIGQTGLFVWLGR
jgi:hypothetical protein